MRAIPNHRSMARVVQTVVMLGLFALAMLAPQSAGADATNDKYKSNDRTEEE